MYAEFGVQLIQFRRDYPPMMIDSTDYLVYAVGVVAHIILYLCVFFLNSHEIEERERDRENGMFSFEITN